MVPFAYSRARSVAAGASGARHGSKAADAGTDFIAGGADMIQLMQERVRNPGQVVDIATLSGLAGIEALVQGADFSFRSGQRWPA